MKKKQPTFNDSLKANIQDSLHYLAEINQYATDYVAGQITEETLMQFLLRRRNEYGYIADVAHTLKVLEQVNALPTATPSTMTYHPFKTEADEYIYYLVELDGKTRQEKLHITTFHYHNQDYAKKWRDEIQQKIAPLQSKNSHYEQAVDTLNTLYESMTDN